MGKTVPKSAMDRIALFEKRKAQFCPRVLELAEELCFALVERFPELRVMLEHQLCETVNLAVLFDFAFIRMDISVVQLFDRHLL